MEKRDFFVGAEYYLVYDCGDGVFLVEITGDVNSEKRVSFFKEAMKKIQEEVVQRTKNYDPPNRHINFINAVPISHCGNTVALLLFSTGGWT